MKISINDIQAYKEWKSKAPEAADDAAKLQERIKFFGSWTVEKLAKASRDDFVEFFSPLWSMAMWGNKAAHVDQLIEDNGLDELRQSLASLLHGKELLPIRWDAFRSKIKRIGPAMASELLAHVHPEEYLPWTKVTIEIFKYLEVPNTPTRSYQLDGKAYQRLCDEAKEMAKQLSSAGIRKPNVMEVNYFVWWLYKHAPRPIPPAANPPVEASSPSGKTAEFLHNDIRDKLADIGRWLGFDTRTEVKVASGSVVDTVWESTIGNMGRVIYVFEVQTKGSIDSLIVNLLKALNNPAVQGVVAVSDAAQLAKIKSHSSEVPNLAQKLKTWDYLQVLDVYESLESVNQQINALNLVPQSF